MEPIYMLWLREVKRYTRSKPQILASLGQPLLYLLALGFGLGAVYQKANGGSYLQFISPGIIGMAVLFSSVFSGIALLWDRQFGFLKETLVAPVPRLEIMIGRTLGSATTSMFQGLLVSVVCLIAGFRPISLAGFRSRYSSSHVIAILFAALGTTIGSVIPDMQAFPIVMNFLVLPIFFLSGALFPLDTSPKALQIISAFDPLSYGVDGMRGALVGHSHFGPTGRHGRVVRHGRSCCCASARGDSRRSRFRPERPSHAKRTQPTRPSESARDRGGAIRRPRASTRPAWTRSPRSPASAKPPSTNIGPTKKRSAWK